MADIHSRTGARGPLGLRHARAAVSGRLANVREHTSALPGCSRRGNLVAAVVRVVVRSGELNSRGCFPFLHVQREQSVQSVAG